MTDDAQTSCFTPFRNSIAAIPLPARFTFPFYYEPHELSRLAAQELQERLSSEDFQHNFGLEGNPDGDVIGKMFGVLVVKNRLGELGYLSAFSGKLGNSNHHPGFVPPVFDMLEEGNFFQEGMAYLRELNQKVRDMESSPEFLSMQSNHEALVHRGDTEIETFRDEMRAKKRLRKEKRQQLPTDMNATERAIIENELIRESLSYKHQLRILLAEWNTKREMSQAKIDTQISILENLKEQRKTLSNDLQRRIFSEYAFLNAKGNAKNLLDIFQDLQLDPPAGAGECAAPKLLQYAFENQLTPICMAEFWWGESPKSEIRKHGQFYPSCRGKCEPILGHMLVGLDVDPNPILKKPDFVPPLNIVYEDDFLVVVNKPSGILSVPGKSDLPDMYSMVREKYPNAEEPMIVHRLDMATSGVLLFTKTKAANKFMQQQFIKKTISKRYVALLDGTLESDEGEIDLPLRLDLNDRPRQLVCYDYGKEAKTRYKVVDRLYGKTRIHFFPITGRTHQLRVHAAHPNGLNMPIIGDDLYGKRDARLHLHAEEITFLHPETREETTVRAEVGF
ncbi:MAG: RluA family pseudouridine synthase [bacterium]|nr:RluA family pseudouridine synthase [bacterium]